MNFRGEIEKRLNNDHEDNSFLQDDEIIVGPLSGGWRISKHQINILKSNLTQNDAGNYTCQPVGPELRDVPVMSACLTLRSR